MSGARRPAKNADGTRSWRHALLEADVSPAVRARARAVFGLDARSLALFRVAVAAVVLGDVATRAPDLTALYTDTGVVPRWLLAHTGLPHAVTFYTLSGSAGLVVAGLVLTALAALALLLGWHTRVASVATWALVVSLQNRNPGVLFAADSLLRLTLFWAMFLPLGRRFSLDARRRPAKSSGRVVGVASVALVVQLAAVFLFAADLKRLGVTWTAGTAVQMALSVEQFGRPLGQWLLHFPRLLHALDYVVLWAQEAVPVLLLSPVATRWCRGIAIAGIAAMQLSFGLCLTVGIFPFITVAATLALVPEAAWDRLARRWPRLATRLGGEAAPRTWPSRLGRAVVGTGVACCLALVLLWNLGESEVRWTLAGSGRRIDASAFSPIIEALRLDQRWAMFAPNPQTEDGWFVIPGHLADGTVVDLRTSALAGRLDLAVVARARRRGVRSEARLDWTKPPLISRTFGDQRWAMYLLTVAGDPTDARLEAFATYLCRLGRHAPAPDAMRSVAVIYLRFDHLPGGGRSPVTRRVLWRGPCAG